MTSIGVLIRTRRERENGGEKGRGERKEGERREGEREREKEKALTQFQREGTFSVQST